MNFKKYPTFSDFQKEQQKSNRLLYVYRNSVYDLSDFAQKHPGGRGPINTYKGQDLENIFFNPAIHRHSQQSLNTLEKYKCGIIESKPSLGQSLNNTKQSSTQGSSSFSTSAVNKKTPIKTNPQTPSIKTKNKTPIKYEDKLNQSMSKLNQSVSSIRSQFLVIPTQSEIQQMQKQKQQKLIQQWKQSEIEELKRQQAEVQALKQDKSFDRTSQSEILTTPRKKIINPYYQAWLEKQQQQQQQSYENILPAYLTQSAQQPIQQQPQQQIQKQQQQQQQSQSVIVSKTQKKVNPYYEEWKRKRAIQEAQQQVDKEQVSKQQNSQIGSQSIIMEENESQISGQPSSINNSFLQRSMSMKTIGTVVQEDLELNVPVFAPKFMTPIKAKFISSLEQI